MTIPDFRLDKERLVRILTDRSALPQVAREMAAFLARPPYAFVLAGLAPTEKGILTVHLARGLTELPPTKPGQSGEDRAKISFTRVRIDPRKANQSGAVTRYSRTNQALPLHSDSSYDPDPHELVVFQMVQADSEGGESQVAPIDRVLDVLDGATKERLSRPSFPFGRCRLPILWQAGAKTKLRYYRYQVDQGCQVDEGLSEEDAAALERLDRVLADPRISLRRKIRSGEILFLNNTKALHGRTAFAEDSPRLMYRIRVHAGCLA